MSKKISRRDFARTSVTAGTAAMVLPGTMLDTPAVAAKTSAAAKGAAAARRFRASLPPPGFGYGGDPVADARDSISLAYAPAQSPSAPEFINGWRVGTSLPAEYSHNRWSASTTWALGNIQCYDDYVAVVRHTPRDVMKTDVEILWLVNADAKEGRDYKPERVMALWDITEREDRWIVENQVGILSSAYTPGRYAISEGASRFIQGYMTEVFKGG